MFETKEHIIQWINQLKSDIANIDAESIYNGESTGEMELESICKLELYIAKLRELSANDKESVCTRDN